MHRAYSLLTVKSIDEDERVIEGIATTPSTDRMEDVVESEGAQFALPIPMMWQHGKDPFVGQTSVGNVIAARPTKDGIPVRIQMERSDEPGRLKDILDFAWQTVKKRLVRGFSIGFRPTEDPEPIKGTFGLRFKKWEWLELSAVTIPANADATITTIKSIDASYRSASGATQATEQVGQAGVSAAPVVRLARLEKPAVKTITEQIQSFEATRQAKAAEQKALMDAAGEKGETLDAEAAEKYDTLTTEVKAIDAHLSRLRDMEELNKSQAKAVVGTDPQSAAASRQPSTNVIRVSDNVPQGIGFARAIMCKMASYAAFRRGDFVSAVDIAKQQYPDDVRVQQYLKAAVPAATTTHAQNAAPLVDPTNLSSEFIEYLRPQTIIGRINGLNRIPFNVRIIAQTSGGNGYWVGQGAPKPLTGFSFTAITHGFYKVAAISVITEELARFSSPSAEALVRNGLAAAVIERMDIDFIDPASAAVTGVQPASITNGLTPLSSAGSSADNVRTDIQNLLEAFLAANVNPTSLVLIMPNTLALSLSLMVNTLGQQEFPNITMTGGSLLGIPVVTSQYAANQSGAGNLVIALNASDLFLSDDGQVTVDASREASLEMSDTPANNSATPTAAQLVSMWQTNSIALRAERFINWTKRRANAVVYMDDVNWGSIGSPS